jgi:hypothetical protein
LPFPLQLLQALFSLGLPDITFLGLLDIVLSHVGLNSFSQPSSNLAMGFVYESNTISFSSTLGLIKLRERERKREIEVRMRGSGSVIQIMIVLGLGLPFLNWSYVTHTIIFIHVNPFLRTFRVRVGIRIRVGVGVRDFVLLFSSWSLLLIEIVGLGLGFSVQIRVRVRS